MKGNSHLIHFLARSCASMTTPSWSLGPVGQSSLCLMMRTFTRRLSQGFMSLMTGQLTKIRTSLLNGLYSSQRRREFNITI
ncbi:hypothetical protein Pcar_3218 [Syntrophotalea carbinolica DSM 2380]|uniref:Uncharacterized protein n=1 Tax=Syntrophotalea carbinolica (strain DSM 2380 / NBRC 103641 / GraBd1) TaxID=338963 RepID=Q0C6U9_SYNC1|nr:hypothetical protein Pcar_3218 [Syntrophotalea carbinolica DSM 2380]